MRSIISVVQTKGGVGKTTVAISLAGQLSDLGHRVSVADSDPQQSSLRWAQPGRLPFPVYNIPLRSERSVSWAQRIDRLDEDFIVVDTAPNDYSVKSAAVISDLVLVPCTPSGLDLESTTVALEVIKEVRRELNLQTSVLLVPSRVDYRTLEGRQIADELVGFDHPVGPFLGNRMSFVRAFSTGLSIGQFAPGSDADREAGELCKTVLRMLDRSGPHDRSTGIQYPAAVDGRR